MAMMKSAMLLFAAVLLSQAAPLQAAFGSAVPEPSNLALFALGLLGVIIGRQSIAKRPSDRGED